MSNIYPDGIDVANEVEEFVRSVASGSVSRRGDEFVFSSCPFCDGGKSHDKNTFSINRKTGQYQCKRSNCNAIGNLWTLSKDKDIAYSLPEPERKKSRRHTYSFRVNNDRDERAAKWVKEHRGIPEEVTYKYHLAFGTEKFKSLYNMEGANILSKPEKFLVWQFTNSNGDKTLWYKFRRTEGDGMKEWSISKDFMLDGKKYHVEPCLFGMGECDYKDPFLILTEGQFDTLALVAAGYGNVVSVPTGKGGFKWFDENDESRNFMRRFDTLIIFGDREGETITLLEDMNTRFVGRIKCVRAADYKDCKDANEILQKYGAEYLQQCVENAELVPLKQVKDLADVEDVDIFAIEKLETGITVLDRKLYGGLPFGGVSIITGKAGEGKSTLASQILARAVQHDYICFAYSGELPDFLFKSWIDFQIAGNGAVFEYKNKFGDNGYSIKKEDRAAISEWYRGKIYIYDNSAIDDDETIGILEMTEMIITRYGVRVVLIDNLMTALDLGVEEKSDKYEKQSSFVKALARMALKYNAIILLVAHKRKESAESDIDNVSGSSDITNLAMLTISYGRGAKNDNIKPDQRKLKLIKNRLFGYTEMDGWITDFDPGCKRIYQEANKAKELYFDYGWKKSDTGNDFVSAENEEVPF